MNVLWTLVKVALSLVVLIPVGLIALGVFGAVLGIAVLFLRLALLGLLAYGAFKLMGRLFRGSAPQPKPKDAARLAPADPYYQQAMRELDMEIPEARARR